MKDFLFYWSHAKMFTIFINMEKKSYTNSDIKLTCSYLHKIEKFRKILKWQNQK